LVKIISSLQDNEKVKFLVNTIFQQDYFAHKNSTVHINFKTQQLITILTGFTSDEQSFDLDSKFKHDLGLGHAIPFNQSKIKV